MYNPVHNLYEKLSWNYYDKAIAKNDYMGPKQKCKEILRQKSCTGAKSSKIILGQGGTV